MTEITFAKELYVEIFDVSAVLLIYLLRVKRVLKGEGTKTTPRDQKDREFGPSLG